MVYKDRAKRNEYQNHWLKERRRKWLANKGCVVCGSVEELEIDHINPDTKVSHKIWSWAAERRAEELEKCQVLCVDCHREKTSAWRATLAHDLEEMHGTCTGYTKFRCRCEECREWKRLAHGREVGRSTTPKDTKC